MKSLLAFAFIVFCWALNLVNTSEVNPVSIDAHDCADYPEMDVDRIKPILVHYREVPTLCKWNGWTVIQSRGQFNWFPKDYFSKKLWEDYRVGFGVPGDEFWLGLDNIYELTQIRNYTLRVTMENFDGVIKTAFYTEFKLLENVYYTLNVSSYYGDTGDSLTRHSSHKFSTRDRDHDDSSGNCAELHQGAWWYHSCHSSNLNGYNAGISGISGNDGIQWNPFVWGNDSLARVEMAIKEI